MQVLSSLKLANAQLLFEIRKRDSSPGASLQTWRTRFMSSVCGGRLPIQIACPTICQFLQSFPFMLHLFKNCLGTYHFDEVFEAAHERQMIDYGQSPLFLELASISLD